MLDVGSWMLDAGCWNWVVDVGYAGLSLRVQSTKQLALVTGFYTKTYDKKLPQDRVEKHR
jgi:hypothetical protein